MSELRTAVGHTAVYGLGNLLAKALGFLMLPFYTRYLTPSDYGTLEILDLSMSLFAMFLTMGMTAAVLRCYGSAPAADKGRVISTAFAFIGGTALLTYAIGLAIAPRVSMLLFGPGTPVSYLLLSFSSFILSYIAILPRTYLRALQASRAFTAVDTAALVVMLLLNVYFVAVLKIGLRGILLSSLIVTGIQVSWLSVWTLRRVGLRFSMPRLQEMLRFGWPLMFSNLAIFALNFSDRFFLQHLRSLDVVGIYAVGYKFGFMLNFLVVQPFYVMWQSRMYIVREKPDHAVIFKRLFVLYSLMLVFAGLAMSVASGEVVRLVVGPKFAASQGVIPVVVCAYVAWGIGFCWQTGMYVSGNTKRVGLVSAAAAIANLALNYVLISAYGLMGAAWATLASFVLIAAGSYVFSQRAFPLPLAAPRVCGIAATGVALYLASTFTNTVSVAASIAMKCALLAAFPLLVWSMRLLSPDEAEVLVSAKERVVSVLARGTRMGARRAAGA